MMNTDMPNASTWNVERRRQFSQLKKGTEVPGYRGYISQYKYHVGDTYGTATHKLQSGKKIHPDILATNENYSKYVGTGLTTGYDAPAAFPRYQLPMATGDNKFTEKMVPGYTGYIPRMPFKFGGTYKNDCDVCIDDWMNMTREHKGKFRDLQKTVYQPGNNQMKSEMRQDDIVRQLNQYRDRKPNGPILLDDKRGPTEAPMPGYLGYVPRSRVTELGLGGRYHTICADSLKVFREEMAQNTSKLKTPYPPIKAGSDGLLTEQAGLTLTKEDPKLTMHRRLYKMDGMIPKYTGYLPQMRYRFGNTYGDTSRSLPVCFHDKPNYGTYANMQIPVGQSQ